MEIGVFVVRDLRDTKVFPEGCEEREKGSWGERGRGVG